MVRRVTSLASLHDRGTRPHIIGKGFVVDVLPRGHGWIRDLGVTAGGDRVGGRLDLHLADMLSAVARRHRVPGAQLAVHHGGETVAAEFGELVHGTRQLVTLDSAFPIGSITKTFTATVAMVLVADGDLKLDAPLGRYVSELDGLGAQLTLRQVLSHTSGLASDPDSEASNDTSVRRYVLAQCRPDNLVVPPGSCFSYSNIGYVLAGHLIEVTTGMNWWEAIEAVLLRPLGIEPVFVAGPGARPVRRPIVTGHSVSPATGRTHPAEQTLEQAEAPAGALAMSALDLVALGRALVGVSLPGVLPAAHVEEMCQAVPGAEPTGLADGWGLGLAVFRNGDTWVGHDGNADGTSCYLRLDPALRSVVAFTSNANTALDMWHDVSAELGAVGLPVASRPAVGMQERPVPAPAGCIGSYRNGSTEYAVTVQDGSHCLAIDGEVLARLTFHEDMIFMPRDITSGQQMHPGRFLRDPVSGDLDRIVVNGRVGRRVGSPGARDADALDRAS